MSDQPQAPLASEQAPQHEQMWCHYPIQRATRTLYEQRKQMYVALAEELVAKRGAMSPETFSFITHLLRQMSDELDEYRDMLWSLPDDNRTSDRANNTGDDRQPGGASIKPAR